MSDLKDSFDRKFNYLRLSITDLCNFRCGYCLPNGCEKGKRDFLNLNEINNIARAFADLGMTKIRITGGEPTLRPDFIDIAQIISDIPQIKSRVFTTNGYKLKKHAQAYFDAGLNGLNVSVDSLDSAKFYQMTKHDKLDSVLSGIEEAKRVGFKNIKINAVLIKNYSEPELKRFMQWVKQEPIAVRFIELMRTATNEIYFKRNHIRSDFIHHHLVTAGWQRLPRALDAGPAIEYSHPKYQGRIGIIAPYSKDFCKSCNRLRISSKGKLHLCLFGEFGISLRHLMQHSDDRPKLIQAIKALLLQKEKSHYLLDGRYGGTQHLASIGG